MMKNKYIIKIRGCDDTTAFVMELSEEELKLVQELCKKSQETSTYACMPVMEILEYNEENRKWYLGEYDDDED